VESIGDLAGNVARTSVLVNIDRTPPGIVEKSRTPAANAAGWNNGDVTVTWSCSDALSGAHSSQGYIPPRSPTGVCRS
jgi:transcription elongation factor